MKAKLALGVAVAVIAGSGLFALSGFGQIKDTPPKVDKKDPLPRSNQLLMRDKLVHANTVLDGLSVEDFGKIAESAEMMRMISRAASWHVIATDEYLRHSKNFQEQATDLVRHAKDKNLEAATLDYMRISLTCVQCHKHVREVQKKEKR
jgi:hypothetical protein